MVFACGAARACAARRGTFNTNELGLYCVRRGEGLGGEGGWAAGGTRTRRREADGAKARAQGGRQGAEDGGERAAEAEKVGGLR